MAGDGCRIGIDAGTGEVRVVAYRERDGRVVEEATAAFPIGGDGERRTVAFDAVGEAVDRALAAVVAGIPAGVAVTGIGIAATASTVAVVDRDGRPIGDGLLWADHRAHADAGRLRAAGHANLERMLGHVSPEWGIAKLAWLAADGALDRRDASILVELADWLGWRLTGVLAANAGTREWGWAGGDDGVVPGDLLRAAGVAARYADRVPGDVRRTGEVLGEALGRVLGQARDGGGLGALCGVPVLVGGMDSYLAAVGMGAGIAGRLCVSVGSSSAVIGGAGCGEGGGRLFGPLRTVLPGEPAAWHGGQTTAGLAAAWAARVLGGSPTTLEREAAASPPGARGVAFRETLLDRRTPRPSAPLTGSWTGLRLDHTRGDLYRAVLEGIAFGLAETCATLRPAEVVASGGMLRSRLFHQVLADVLGLPVRRLREVSSAAALGAAFADRPGLVAGFAQAAATARPTGADYAGARARYLAAELPPVTGEAT